MVCVVLRLAIGLLEILAWAIGAGERRRLI